jgi:hypothetical protein
LSYACASVVNVFIRVSFQHLGQEKHADARPLDIIALDHAREKLPWDCGHHAGAITTAGANADKLRLSVQLENLPCPLLVQTH